MSPVAYKWMWKVLLYKRLLKHSLLTTWNCNWHFHNQKCCLWDFKKKKKKKVIFVVHASLTSDGWVVSSCTESWVTMPLWYPHNPHPNKTFYRECELDLRTLELESVHLSTQLCTLKKPLALYCMCSTECIYIYVYVQLQSWYHTVNRATFVCLSVCLSVCSPTPPRSFDGSLPNLVGVCRWTSELPLRGQQVNG